MKKTTQSIKTKLQGNKKDGYSLTLTNGKYTFSENFTHEELEEIKKLLIKKI